MITEESNPYLGERLEFRLQRIRDQYEDVLSSLSAYEGEDEDGGLRIFGREWVPYLNHGEVVALEDALRGLVREAQNLAYLAGIDLEAYWNNRAETKTGSPKRQGLL